MSWKYSLYPDNWKELALACKERAEWKCEHCGIHNGEWRLSRDNRYYRVRLTAAHLDHDPENPNPRLMALCELCHLAYDLPLHTQNQKRTIWRKRYERQKKVGQLELFALSLFEEVAHS